MVVLWFYRAEEDVVIGTGASYYMVGGVVWYGYSMRMLIGSYHGWYHAGRSLALW
jgi:hypothetical protein